MDGMIALAHQGPGMRAAGLPAAGGRPSARGCLFLLRRRYGEPAGVGAMGEIAGRPPRVTAAFQATVVQADEFDAQLAAFVTAL